MAFPLSLLIPGLGRGDEASFSGLLDLVPNAAAAYSVARRLSSTYTGSLIRIRRSSDNAESDFTYGSNNELDAAAVATFIGAGSGFIVTLYDQSGNTRNVTQGTAGNQPLYVASGQNGKPATSFDGANDVLATANTTPFSGDFSATAISVSKPDSATRAEGFWGLGNSGVAGQAWGLFSSLVNSGKFSTAHAGLRNYNATSAVSAAFMVVAASKEAGLISTKTRVFKNGVQGTDNGSSSATTPNLAATQPICIGSWANRDSVFDGDQAELILWTPEISDANRQAAEGNINAFYAIY